MQIEYTHGLLIRALSKELAIDFYKQLTGTEPPADGTIEEYHGEDSPKFHQDGSKVWEFLPAGGLKTLNKKKQTPKKVKQPKNGTRCRSLESMLKF